MSVVVPKTGRALVRVGLYIAELVGCEEDTELDIALRIVFPREGNWINRAT